MAPKRDLVLWSRLGSAYGPGELRRPPGDRALVELHDDAGPAADVALYRAGMADWPAVATATRLSHDRAAGSRPTTTPAWTSSPAYDDGPVTARELPDT